MCEKEPQKVPEYTSAEHVLKTSKFPGGIPPDPLGPTFGIAQGPHHPWPLESIMPNNSTQFWCT